MIVVDYNIGDTKEMQVRVRVKKKMHNVLNAHFSVLLLHVVIMNDDKIHCQCLSKLECMKRFQC